MGDSPRSPAVSAGIDRLAGGASLTMVGKVVAMGLDFLRLALMARLLGPGPFGLFALGWSLLRISGISAPLGLHNGVVHFAARYWRRDALNFRSVVIRSGFLGVGLGAVGGMLLFLLAPWLGDVVFDAPTLVPIFRWFGLTMPFMTGVHVLAAATRVSQRMLASTIANDVVPSVLNLLLFLLFFGLVQDVISAVWATVLAYGISFGVALFFVRRLLGTASRWAPAAPLSPTATGVLLRYSLPSALAGFSAVLMGRMDRIFIGYFRVTEEVGIYQAASQVSTLFTIILFGFGVVLGPMIADLYHAGDRVQMNELFRVSTKWSIYASLPLFVTICLVPEATISALFGAEFAAGGRAMVLLAIGQLINASTGAVGIILTMTGNQKQWLLISGGMLGLNVLLNGLLVPGYGYVGAALATMVTLIGLYGSGLILVRRLVGIWPYDRRYWKGGLALLPAAGAGWLLKGFLPAGTWVPMLATAAVATSIFLFLLLLQGLDEEDRQLLNLLLARLR